MITIALQEPLKIGEKVFESVSLRKPNSGELRGVRLAELMVMETDAVAQVVQRISEPLITSQQFFQLDPADLTAISLEVVGFLTGTRPSPDR